MTLYYVEPRDPLVVRDGRPNQGRSEPDVLPFPYPGTLAGWVRTRLGSDPEGRFVCQNHLQALLDVQVRGPLLARPDTAELLCPAPRDCWLRQREHYSSPELRGLHPIELPPGAIVDSELGTSAVGLAPEEVVRAKPSREEPRFWPWELLQTWLVAPESVRGEDVVARGEPALPIETRLHVKLGQCGTAEEGMLFTSAGLRFASGRNGRQQLALAGDVGPCSVDGHERSVDPGVAPAGGERRLVRWRRAQSLQLPALPSVLRDYVSVDEPAVDIRIVLLTPALFASGWRPGDGPGQLLQTTNGVRVALRAACVPRPATVSGWDLARRQPRPSRRLAPAGSVYWLRLHGPPRARVDWATEVWMSNVSDEAQDRRDGYGLAVLGVVR